MTHNGSHRAFSLISYQRCEGVRAAVTVQRVLYLALQVNEDPLDHMSARAVKTLTVMHELLRPCHNPCALSDIKHVNHDPALAQRLGHLVNSSRKEIIEKSGDQIIL